MDLNLLFYCFLTVVIVFGGTYYFYSNRLESSAAIYFLGTVIAAVYFGFRWFSSPGAASKPGAWPPAVNYCPDFLTLTQDITGKKICIDMIGVAKGGTNTLQVSDGTQTTDAYIFDLKTTSINRLDELCGEAKEKGVTWEGVWNGETCSNTAPPLPP
jgi:hypothetical protein